MYNAANEECVDAFHERRIAFPDIVDTVAQVVHDWADAPQQVAGAGSESGTLDVDQVLSAERWARSRAHEVLGAS